MSEDWEDWEYEDWEDEEEEWDEDLDEEPEPYCLGSYVPGDETCDFRCEWRELCEKI